MDPELFLVFGPAIVWCTPRFFFRCDLNVWIFDRVSDPLRPPFVHVFFFERSPRRLW